jgi:hypothetical protein
MDPLDLAVCYPCWKTGGCISDLPRLDETELPRVYRRHFSLSQAAMALELGTRPKAATNCRGSS